MGKWEHQRIIEEANLIVKEGVGDFLFQWLRIERGDDDAEKNGVLK